MSGEVGDMDDRNSRNFGSSIMSLYEGANTRVFVDPELSEEFKAEMLQ